MLFQASKLENDQQNRYKFHFPSNLVSLRYLFFIFYFFFWSNQVLINVIFYSLKFRKARDETSNEID